MRRRWCPADRTFRDEDGTWSVTTVHDPSTEQSRMFEKIRRERGEYRGIVTWRYEGPDLGPRYPYQNQVRSPDE